MPQLEQCPKLEKFLDSIYANGAIPKEFAEHARACEHCLFWLSHTLAIAKSLLATKRPKFEGCPAKYYFRNLLIITIRTMRELPERLKKYSSKIDYLKKGASEGYVAELRGHIEECELCRQYFEDLFETTLKEQVAYAKSIISGACPETFGKNFMSEQEYELPQDLFERLGGKKPN